MVGYVFFDFKFNPSKMLADVGTMNENVSFIETEL